MRRNKQLALQVPTAPAAKTATPTPAPAPTATPLHARETGVRDPAAVPVAAPAEHDSRDDCATLHPGSARCDQHR